MFGLALPCLLTPPLPLHYPPPPHLTPTTTKLSHRQDPSGDAAASAQKHLTYYELDLGLNHVLRKWSDPVDNGANMLIPVPGGGDGPGGVLVCAENFLLYRHQVCVV
jgi:hypothetical protein